MCKRESGSYTDPYSRYSNMFNLSQEEGQCKIGTGQIIEFLIRETGNRIEANP